jgi:hypothetical protein
MKSNDPTLGLQIRAAETLKSFLGQVSAIRVKEIRLEPRREDRACDVLATIDVHGHPHTLACAVTAHGTSKQTQMALEELRDHAAHRPATTMPLLISPHLPPGVRNMCKENKIGFLDFDGNARLVLDEVFIAKRTLPPRGVHPASAARAIVQV